MSLAVPSGTVNRAYEIGEMSLAVSSGTANRTVVIPSKTKLRPNVFASKRLGQVRYRTL
jgi:hypothetical protein